MQPLTLASRLMHKTAIWLSAIGIAAASLAAVPATVAFADEGNPPAATGGLGSIGEALLVRCLHRARAALDAQAQHLERADEVAEQAAARIEEAKANGRDTTALEAALATFNDQLSTAHRQHHVAANIIQTHAGYDDDGQVIDREQARDTCQRARQALQDVRQLLRQAVGDFIHSVREWRRAHRPGEG